MANYFDNLSQYLDGVMDVDALSAMYDDWEKANEDHKDLVMRRVGNRADKDLTRRGFVGGAAGSPTASNIYNRATGDVEVQLDKQYADASFAQSSNLAKLLADFEIQKRAQEHQRKTMLEYAPAQIEAMLPAQMKAYEQAVMLYRKLFPPDPYASLPGAGMPNLGGMMAGGGGGGGGFSESDAFIKPFVYGEKDYGSQAYSDYWASWRTLNPNGIPAGGSYQPVDPHTVPKSKGGLAPDPPQQTSMINGVAFNPGMGGISYGTTPGVGSGANTPTGLPPLIPSGGGLPGYG